MVAERPVEHVPAAPGLGGYVGPSAQGPGGVGDVGICVHKMVEGMAHLERIAANVEADSINSERYVREMAMTMRDVVAAIRRMFEQEPWRVTALISASKGGGSGPRMERQVKGVMEHRVVQGRRPSMETRPYSGSGIRSLSLRWVRLRRCTMR